MGRPRRERGKGRALGPIDTVIDRIVVCLESISLDFDRWEDPQVRGPGAYFVVVLGSVPKPYTAPMGNNRWPAEECPTVTGDFDRFFSAARTVANERDGAVVVTADGAIQEQMVRVHDLSQVEIPDLDVTGIEYEDWMGARHMSALDTSLRPDVIAAITLSEEDGRVTVFDDGRFTSYRRAEIDRKWRATE